MSREEILGKLIRIRGYCFRLGVLDRQADFLQAFRDLNRLYVLARA